MEDTQPNDVPQTMAVRRKKKENLFYSLLAALFVVGLGVAGWGIYDMRESYRELAEETHETRNALAGLMEWANENTSILSERLAEIEGELEIVNERRARNEESLQRQLTSLQTELARTAQRSFDLATVVKRWENRIVRINCTYGGRNVRGSGLVLQTPYSSYPIVLTNKHVLTDLSRSSVAPDTTCTVLLPNEGGEIAVPVQDILVSTSDDVGYLELKTENARVQALASDAPRVCSGASSGDTILVMGYPTIGAQSSLTVTEGIISGYEDGFYITSAKVEQGNSGGVAVLARESCYLGIPTFARHGVLESLARILDARRILSPTEGDL